MALLTPDCTYIMNGVIINEKIIPDGTKWINAANAQKAGFARGDLYKKQRRLYKNTGKAQYVTIHNTEDILGANDDAEQYTRATYNENMGSARVHFYVDDTCGWQNLRAGTGLCFGDPVGSAEVGWHAGDGSTTDGGNMNSLALEIIMNENPEHDAKAYDNGARIAAWLLWKHELTVDRLVTHTYWVNKSAGNMFTDVDKQCCNVVPNKKWCPLYILGSYSADKALKNWLAFKAVVKCYLDELNGVGDSSEAAVEVKDNTPDEWAVDSVGFAVDKKILFGDAVGDYKLHKNCSRQEMIVFLYRIHNLINNGG